MRTIPAEQEDFSINTRKFQIPAFCDSLERIQPEKYAFRTHRGDLEENPAPPKRFWTRNDADPPQSEVYDHVADQSSKAMLEEMSIRQYRPLFCALVFICAPVKAQDLESRLSAIEGFEDTRTSVEFLLRKAEQIQERGFEAAAASWRSRAERYVAALESGNDPYQAEAGNIVNRGYRSRISPKLQGYAIYLPENYSPDRSYPLYVALHGGSSNGNLFLGVVLGNNMDWETYDEHLYDDYEPRWSPDWIVVAPTGFGQILWRWMGEQDVLDVIDDVSRNYNVDENRVVLGGLSNGGVGAYAIGARHAYRFSMVQAMAGAPSWLQYLGRGITPVEQREATRFSAMHLARNFENTNFHYYHGRNDGGPMRPAYVEAFTAHLAREGIEAGVTWFDTGHDILYWVHRHGRIYSRLAETTRDPRPAEVRVISGDYRAARQHWVEVTRIPEFPSLANVHARIEGETLRITTDQVSALALRVDEAPLPERVTLIVDDATLLNSVPRAQLGDRLNLVKNAEGWALGFPVEQEREKRPGLSGPITDAYYDRMVHVFGTQDAESTDELRRAAERGARGWPLWAWDLGQEVIPDSECTEEIMRDAHVVLYGNARENEVLARVAGALPIQIEEDAVVVGNQRFEGEAGVRFVYPNPLAPERYVIVQAATSPGLVRSGNRLPEFSPDFVVYNARMLRGQQRRISSRRQPALLQGHFDDQWRLPEELRAQESGDGEETAHSEGADDTFQDSIPASTLPIPRAPAVPNRPRRFGASASDPAGRAARAIWARVPQFENYRALIPGAVWRVERESTWDVQEQQACLDALAEAGVNARLRPEPSAIVPSPVEVIGPVEGVWMRMTHEERPLLMSCEMALRLPAIMRILKEEGVFGVEILSSYRTSPFTSFHTMGLALDLSRFWTREGWLSVQEHYVATPNRRTCAGREPRDNRAASLRRIACALSSSNLLSSVLTPNYNEGHRDHFHIDARPNDPRFFLR